MFWSGKSRGILNQALCKNPVVVLGGGCASGVYMMGSVTVKSCHEIQVE